MFILKWLAFESILPPDPVTAAMNLFLSSSDILLNFRDPSGPEVKVEVEVAYDFWVVKEKLIEKLLTMNLYIYFQIYSSIY